MTVCEFQVENFNACGNDDYLYDFAAYLDRMFESGWELMDSERDTCRGGWWRVWLYREKSPRLLITSES
jgi:hypothetical protein